MRKAGPAVPSLGNKITHFVIFRHPGYFPDCGVPVTRFDISWFLKNTVGKMATRACRKRTIEPKSQETDVSQREKAVREPVGQFQPLCFRRARELLLAVLNRRQYRAKRGSERGGSTGFARGRGAEPH